MISTHILDTTKGVAAKDVTVVLEQKNNDTWTEIGTDKTSADRRRVGEDRQRRGIEAVAA